MNKCSIDHPAENGFRECVDRVMRAYECNMAKPTLDVMRRRYNVMEGEILDLYGMGRISTLCPQDMTAEDIESIFTFMRSKDGINGSIKPSSLRKDMVNLRRLCMFDGNRCVDEFKVRFPGCRLTDSQERLPVFSKDQVLRIFAKDLRSIQDESLIRSYGLLALYFGAGLRTVELRNALAGNISIGEKGAFIHLDVVKGKGSYGKPRDAMILPQMVPMLRMYLDWRSEYLEEEGIDSEFYFFSTCDGSMATDSSIRSIRKYAEQDLGIGFDGRKCRRSYGQFMKDQGVSIEAISVLMGHSTTETTEGYYARMSSNMAMDDALHALKGI